MSNETPQGSSELTPELLTFKNAPEELPANLEVEWGESKVLISDLPTIFEDSQNRDRFDSDKLVMSGGDQCYLDGSVIVFDRQNLYPFKEMKAFAARSPRGRFDEHEQLIWCGDMEFMDDNHPDSSLRALDNKFGVLMRRLWGRGTGEVVHHGDGITASAMDSSVCNVDYGKFEVEGCSFKVMIWAPREGRRFGSHGGINVYSLSSSETLEEVGVVDLAENFAKVFMIIMAYSAAERGRSTFSKLYRPLTLKGQTFEFQHIETVRQRHILTQQQKRHIEGNLGDSNSSNNSTNWRDLPGLSEQAAKTDPATESSDNQEPSGLSYEKPTDSSDSQHNNSGVESFQAEKAELHAESEESERLDDESAEDTAQSNTESEATKPEYHSSQYVVTAVEQVTPKYGLNDIGGMEAIKQEIKDIALAFQHPGIMEKWGAKNPQGILFYGDPGIGKTMFAHALANEIGGDLWIADSASLYDMWQSLPGKNMQAMFDKIKQHQGKLVVFFDEIDSIISMGEGSGRAGSVTHDQVAGIFKQALNTLSDEKPDVIIVGATNNLERIDPSLIRSGRFDYKIYIPLPDEETRTHVVSTILAKRILNSGSDPALVGYDINAPEVAKATEGLSGADINEIITRVARKKAMHNMRTGKVEPITQADIMKATEEFKQSS